MNLESIQAEVSEASAFVPQLKQEISRVLVGQDKLVHRMLICLLTNNHLLVEGLPGLAKTLAVTTLSQAISAQNARIQFTPDLLPADVVGTNIYNPSTQTFSAKPGPVFTNLLLADEINRAPAKVQSALLEAMQERQCTFGGETHPLPSPFMVMATQNPLDQEGTYPLPEAQMDRFMMKVLVSYPNRNEELEVLRLMGASSSKPTASAIVSLEAIATARDIVDRIYIDPKVEDYLLDIVIATRPGAHVQLSDRQKDVDLAFLKPLVSSGASPRATLGLARAARAMAFLEGRAHVLPEDIKELAPDILRHRIIPTYEAQAEQKDADAIVTQILNTLHTP